MSSSDFKAISCRDGQVATLILKDGIKVSLTTRAATKNDKQGTYVEYTPAQSVYNVEPIHIDFEEVKKMCRDWSYLCKGLEFNLTNGQTGEKIKYLSNNGLLDFMKDNGGRAINKTPLSIQVQEGDIHAEIVMEWTDSRAERSYVYTNGLENPEGGSSLTGAKTALTNFFKKKLKGEVSPDTLRRGLFYAISCQLPNPSFSDQRKGKVNNIELRGICQRATTKMLEDFEMRHKDEFDKILELLSKEVKAEIAAERVRKQVLEAAKDVEKNQKKKVFASDKLKDAEFLGQDAILLVCEGDSALNGMAQARNTDKTGLMCVKGKIINCLSNDDEKIFQNEEIKLLLSAMNIVPGKYDSKKLRYGRLGICTDADSDGYHIGLLVMACLLKLAPQFIEEGRLCWLRSPLFIVEQDKNRSYYFNDEEFDAARKQGKIKGEVHRAKGLGSLEAIEAHESMFTPEYQRLDVFKPDQLSFDLLYSLMGEDVEPRTDFIFKNVDFSLIRE